MLKKLRIILAAVFFVGITLLLVGIGQQWWGWMAKLQFLPSCLALNFGVIIGVLLLTLVLGRLYCSVICPMGVFQDIIIWLRKKTSKKRFNFNKERKFVRYFALGATVAGIGLSSQFLVALIAPYSAYGRIVRSIVGLAEGQSIAPALLVTAAVTLVVILVFAWLWGREWCSSVCPVGTVLGTVSRFSLFRPVIDTDKCVNCGMCAHKCKASCIDSKQHEIDGSRCVVCFDCLGNCSKHAIQYKFVGFKGAKLNSGSTKADAKCSKPEDSGRRAFMATTALVGGSVIASAQNKKVDGGLADVTDKQSPERAERLVPPGAKSVKNFYDKCTACQLCVSNCPNDVLRASTDIEHFLQPVMGFENGFCRPECTTCSDLCPAGAILPVAKEEKLDIKIGTAKVNLELCFAANGEARCGNCAYHCPSGAIRMVQSEGYRNSIPVVNEEQCIGCGACEFLCPSRPISAITVDGISTHRNLG